jgi:hypothetical protein
MTELAELALDEASGGLSVAQDGGEEAEIPEADDVLAGRGCDRPRFERLLVTRRESGDPHRSSPKATTPFSRERCQAVPRRRACQSTPLT